MKGSLAERQAALLKQNSELNERVEAIEQRRQQQQQTRASGSSTRDLHETPAANADPYDLEDGDDSESRNATVVPRSIDLTMDLSASIDSFGVPSLEPREAQRSSESKSKSSSATRLQSRQRSAKRLPPHETTDVQQRSPSTDDKPSAAVTGARSAKQSADSPDGLGLEATVRYQKARLRVLQDELETANGHVKNLQTAQSQLKNQNDDLKNENSALVKKQQQTQQLLDKQRELSAAQDAKQRLLESQLAAAQTRVDDAERAEKQTAQQFRSKDVRLNRALEELEKLKLTLADAKRSAVGGNNHGESDREAALVRANKTLEKHKSELLVAFKKQLKLIDVLKRQRIHMEAAKMLSFTEEEFSKTLELG